MRIIAAGLTCLVASLAQGQNIDSELRRFAAGYLGPRPGATVDVTIDRTGESWAGRYLVATAIRSVAAEEPQKSVRDQLNFLVDPGSRTVVVGVAFPLQASAAITRENLPQVVEAGLPKLIGDMMQSSRVRVRWPGSPTRPTPVVPLTAEVFTGYDTMKLAVAVTADAAYFAIGSAWPLDRDPRAVRRERLVEAEIQWDPGSADAPLKVVEFSDYQCPACKRSWEDLSGVLRGLDGKARHGLVNFPLVSSHPWALRAAVAGVCIGLVRPELVVTLKEELYRLQDQLTLESLDDTVFGFVGQHGLDLATFRSCYMKDPAIATVHRQLSFGWGMGVLATPTYMVNGELFSFSDAAAAKVRLEAILAADGFPEKTN